MLDQLIEELSNQPRSSSELQRRLGVSQPAVSRLIRRAGPRVARLGRGRSTRYLATRELFDTAYRLPLFAVADDGGVEELGSLCGLRTGGVLVESTVGKHTWLLGESGIGQFDGLPYFLDDLRPAGFIGRQIARRLAPAWGVSDDPRDWLQSHVGRYLLRRGAELPGHLLLGDEALSSFQRLEHQVVDVLEYPALAARAMAEGVAGSSAAGEQPKFAVYRGDRVGHVIVKFSPATTTPEAQRWRDLLVSEAHALTQLVRLGVPCAKPTIHVEAGRVFLESPRFDRVGARGRRPALSLRMVDAEFVGRAFGWANVGSALQAQRLIAPADLERLILAETFGGWIGNSDMHLGNVSLTVTERGFVLLPIYDMLPMALAPTRGEIPAADAARPPVRTQANRPSWDRARRAAVSFWQAVQSDPRCSDTYRRIAEDRARRCDDHA